MIKYSCDISSEIERIHHNDRFDIGYCGTILMNPYIDRSKNQHRRTRYACVFQHIQDPYAVFKTLKQLTFDVHADVSYPNASRPAVNQGYETRQNSGEAQDI